MRRDVFQAIADPTRRKILILLGSSEMTPNEIAEYFNITRQAVSKHIKILTECNLLLQEPSGREIYYRLNADTIKEVDDWLEPFRFIWEQRFDELDKLLSKSNNKNKE
ncbi:MAG: ArsR/SmtB family transcription factor [Syntrophothermus sp.]